MFVSSVPVALQRPLQLAIRQVAVVERAVALWLELLMEAFVAPLPETKESLAVAAPVVVSPVRTRTGDCSALQGAEMIETLGVLVGYSRLQLMIDPFSRLLPRLAAEMQMVRAVERLRDQIGESLGRRDLKDQEQAKPRVTYSAASVGQFVDHIRLLEVVAFC